MPEIAFANPLQELKRIEYRATGGTAPVGGAMSGCEVFSENAFQSCATQALSKGAQESPAGPTQCPGTSMYQDLQLISANAANGTFTYSYKKQSWTSAQGCYLQSYGHIGSNGQPVNPGYWNSSVLTFAAAPPVEPEYGQCPAAGPASSDPQKPKPLTSPQGGKNHHSGDPIDIRKGNMFHAETDLELPTGLSFTRHYDSHDPVYKTDGSNAPVFNYMLGNWRGSFLATGSNGNVQLQYGVAVNSVRPATALVMAADGTRYAFTSKHNTSTNRFVAPWTSPAPAMQMTTVQGVSGAWTALELDNGSGVTEVFNTSGQLTAIKDGNGTRLTINRTGNKVNSVTDRFGNVLAFEYASKGGVQSLVTLKLNGTTRVTYNYTSKGYLQTVTYAGGGVRQYFYEDAAFPMGLTRIRNELNQDTASWTYDNSKRAIASAEAPGNMTVSLDYQASVTHATPLTGWYWDGDWLRAPRLVPQFPVPAGSPAVEENFPNGLVARYEMIEHGGTLRTTRKTREHNGITAEYLTSYDAAGNITQTTDWNGSITTYSYDSQNREISRTEGAGTSSARTVSTEWHASLQKPVKVTTPAIETVYAYNTDGSLASQTETDLTAWNAGSRSTTYTYTTLGQLQSVDGPLPGTADTTTYAYNAQGRLTSITNALGHITQITAHNYLGAPQTLIDANGITTQLAFDSRGRLISSTRVDPQAGNLVTTFTRDLAGNITRVTLPDASYTDYEYNALGQVMAIIDTTGARIEYERDAESNITRTHVRHANGALVRRLDQTFDGLKQVKEAAGLNTTHGTYDYDHNGNPTRAANGLDLATENLYDALNRITRSTDALGAETHYAYDAEGNLATVTDARDLSTTYSYDGLGCLRTLTSPDTGITNYTCDKAGNVTSKTDARGVTATYGYDALSRLTSTVYSNAPNEMALFGYDATANGNKGKGRLTAAQNDGADIARKFDARGNLIEESRSFDGSNYVTAYGYNNADRLTSITYPSGRTVTYSRNAAGQVTSVSTSASSTGNHTVASSIVWAPFGGVESFTNGNGLAETRTYDTDGVLTGISIGSLFSRSYTRDAAGRITAIADTDPLKSETYGYSDVDRVTSASGPYGSRAYTYDEVGNRLSQNENGNSSAYAYGIDSNRLYQITGNDAASLDYDAAGNTVEKGTVTFTYNASNRLQAITVPGTNGPETTQFAYTALGERVLKDGPQGKTHFHFDAQGKLIAESESTGTVIREYIWLDDKPLAVIAKRNNGTQYELFAVHSDHLDTAIALTDSAQQVAWRYNREPFGELTAGSNTVKWPLRFPGQYEDQETGFFYNYFRDYDPQTGRYIESDPIGLEGGINTYAYAHGNPVIHTDPTGEIVPILVGCSLNPGCVAAVGAIGGSLGSAAGTWLGGGSFGAGLLSMPVGALGGAIATTSWMYGKRFGPAAEGATVLLGMATNAALSGISAASVLSDCK